jgi:DNA polymerase-3 subunit epsilon
MMRQIILDTETTGLEVQEGHRIIEIGAIVIQKRQITQEIFHTYLNPERESDLGALKTHELTTEFLSDKPRFPDIAASFIRFIEGAELIIHNAKFDIGFLNYEFALLNQGYKPLDQYCRITDSLALAQKLYPSQKNNLDALASRCGVSKSKRGLHGALSDAELLAQVYLRMTSGQPSLFEMPSFSTPVQTAPLYSESVQTSELPVYKANAEEIKAHQTRLAAIYESAGHCIWEED